MASLSLRLPLVVVHLLNDPLLVNQLDAFSRQHGVGNAHYVRKFDHRRVPSRCLQPRGQHEKINVDGTKPLTQRPFVVTDLIVDDFPRFPQPPVTTSLSAWLFSWGVGETIRIIVELKGVLYRVGALH